MTPREKGYDPERVLEVAMRLFWEGGYEATSVRDLEEATGVNRYSLYDSFGSKEGLFLRALDHYRDTVISEVLLAELESAHGSLEEIEGYLLALVDLAVREDGPRGCLMTWSAAELSEIGEEGRERVRSHMLRLEEAFHRGLLRAQEEGEISGALDLRSEARRLTATAQGILLLSGVHQRPFFQSVVASAVAGLR